MTFRLKKAAVLFHRSATNPHDALNSRRRWFTASAFLLTLFAQSGFAQGTGSGQAVSALGRIEPAGGTVHVAASSTPQSIMGGIVRELHVAEGDSVTRGQLLITLDTAAVMEAAVIEAKAAVELSLSEVEASRSQVEEACVRADIAERESERRKSLLERGLAGEEEAESAQGEAEARRASCNATSALVRSAEAKSKVARAHLDFVKAERDRTYVFAPMDATVLDVHSKPGEFITIEGAMTLGDLSRMVAIAEVYETDIFRVEVGQKATVSSTALASDLSGSVHAIQRMVAKQDQMGTDPAARKDARIIEVEILLDDPEPVSQLTNLQVDVVIHP